MTAQQIQPYPDRLAELEFLAGDTGLMDELRARKRAENDKKRSALAAELAALPDSSRELTALAKDFERARAAFDVARTVFKASERVMKEKQSAYLMTRMARDGEPQRLLNELLKTAPSELREALEDISFASELLRCAVRIDETSDRTWMGARITRVTSNVAAISDARAQLDDAREAVLALMKNGTIPSAEAVKRGAAILEAAMVPVFAFVDQRRWDQRRSIAASDLVAEVSGFAN
jgi:hypothetical protein